MNAETIRLALKALLADYKGLLAMDESTNTSNKRFAPLGIAQNVDTGGHIEN